MKKIILFLIAGILLLPAINTMGQGVESSLNEAKASYNAGNLEGARYSLQQAMNELDLAIAKDILELLPLSMDDMPFSGEDETAGSASVGFAGLFVSRTYQKDESASASIQIIADSPMLAGLNAILALPMLGSDPNQKRVRLDGYRAILHKQQDESGTLSWDLQLPFGSSLLTMNFVGISDEKKVLEMANTVAIEKIAKMLQ